MKNYPDINSIIEQKERHRRRLAALSFEEKIDMVFKLTERRKFFQSARAAGDARRSPRRPATQRKPK